MTSLFEEITSSSDPDVPVRRVTITVNGRQRTLDVEPRLLLAHLLRQGLQLTGTHTGCDTTNCGACTVLFDGTPVKSCTMLAVQADGHVTGESCLVPAPIPEARSETMNGEPA